MRALSTLCCNLGTYQHAAALSTAAQSRHSGAREVRAGAAQRTTNTNNSWVGAREE